VDLGISGKTALVLGGGGGLGGAIARALAAEGARTAVADVDPRAAARTVQAVEDGGGKAMAVEWDLGLLDSVDTHVAAVEGAFGPVEILVNNTGGPPPSPVLGQGHDMWLQHFRSMVLSVIAVTDRVAPTMRKRGWGRIITSASSGVIAPIPGLGLSNALRAGLLGWSKTLAREVAADGVTCNVIVPGRIATQRIRLLDQARADREGKSAEQTAAESVATIPVGRYGDPREYAAVAAFLASEQASYVTGSVVRVDGGFIASV
jgi:3-oxoacyl-[acyl-carrier protein] reductase